MGVNLFNCISSDGNFKGVVKAGGNAEAKDVFATQLAGNGNCKAIGDWYTSCGAKEGDSVEVTWTSPTDIEVTHIPQ